MTCISDRIVFCSGIRRECDGGTAWERVEMGDCPLTPPTQDIQVKPFEVLLLGFLLCMQVVHQQQQVAIKTFVFASKTNTCSV